ncbi:MAG: N-acetyltransferase [Clostridia bacterium]|nr:N-acetyltransferase [Clostridia bacterium]
MTHTYVDNEYQGQGIAKQLVMKVVNNANMYKTQLTADCSYANNIIKKLGENKMTNYFDTISDYLKEYFSILSSDIPDFLNDYIQTPEMQKQANISVTCGTIYSKMFNIDMWYSSLDHSVAVALIVCHFTKDKKQTLSGLLHDIATPVFKHCIDFMNGDHETQESTEGLTTQIIANSKEIMALLNRDGIKIEEVCDYHIYPIADNDTPKLSADRLEYTFSNGLGVRRYLWTLDEVRKVYNNIEVGTNESGEIEMCFGDIALAEKFVSNMRILSSSYIDSKTKLAMQFFADIVKRMSEDKVITISDMYSKSEKEVIAMIENYDKYGIAKIYNYWKNLNDVKESEEYVKDTYCVSIKAKIRYINPLVKVDGKCVRIKEISNKASKDIDDALNYKTPKYAYIDMDFEK